jgi:hypothetical protein
MERLTGQNADRDTTRHHLDAARAAVQAVIDMATPDLVTLSGRLISQRLGVAMNELISVDQQISLDAHAAPDALHATLGAPHAAPEVPRVACTFCGSMIMPTATLCGFCWLRRADPPTAKSGLNR